MTQRVWHSWVFPERNSPYISVMDPVSIPPVQSKQQLFTLTNQEPIHPPRKRISLPSKVNNLKLTLENLIKFFWSRSDLDDFKPLCMKLACTGKAQRDKLWRCRLKIYESCWSLYMIMMNLSIIMSTKKNTECLLQWSYQLLLH